MSRLLYIPRKILATLGYGALYNWWCTQEQHKAVEYGYLYNWYAVADSRNIANTGWHVPTYSEIQDLRIYLDSSGTDLINIAGEHLKEISSTYWSATDNADNSSGFNGRGSGERYGHNGIYTHITNYGVFGSCTLDGIYVGGFRLSYDDKKMQCSSQFENKNAGTSIRLLKDSTILTNGQVGSYTGNDGKIYSTICIGTQEWLSENLMETKYRNGDLIPEVTDNASWAALTTGARCSYNNTESNAGTTKKLAPTGWHISSDTEWNTLITTLGGSSIAGGKLKKEGFLYWDTPNTGATNEVDFNLFGAGQRGTLGLFYYIKQGAYVWTTTDWYGSGAVWIYFDANHANIYSGDVPYINGASIRLIKDTSDWVEGETVTDADGNVCQTVKIGDQVWTASNWKCTKWDDGTPIESVTDNASWAALVDSPAYCWYDNDINNK